jgi:hypothetical protein
MRRLQLVAHGEPSDVIELNTVSEPVLGQEDVINPVTAYLLLNRYVSLMMRKANRSAK